VAVVTTVVADDGTLVLLVSEGIADGARGTVLGSLTWFIAEFTEDRKGPAGDHRGQGVLGTISDCRGSKSSLKVSGCDAEGFCDLFKAAAVVA
jgi:hypothetical protein